MATTKTLKVEKLTSTIGAEVLDVDLEQLREDPDLPGALMDTLEHNGVLVFRGLFMDDETQVEFCHRLGEIVLFPGQTNPAIFVVTLDPAKNQMAEYLKSTVGWHIDGTMDPIPAKATMLSAKVLSAKGGETEFASTYAAYDGLTAEEKERFANLRVYHTQESSQRSGHPNPTPEQLAEWRKRSREQPLVWTHHTGRKSLVIGHSADYIIGMDREQGRAILRDLDARATTPDRVYRHTWSQGDTVIWDNRGVLHRVTPYDPNSQREMHRTTLAGDEPIR
jgi:alpha-ketoglutarate-dependent taurine dioxygenase